MTLPEILIVEDELIIAMDLQETLAQQGFTVLDTLPSGEQALALCQNRRPDLVLLDNRLQGALTGLETARELRRLYDLPAVLLTAYFDQQMLHTAEEAGIFGYLIKPYDERELCATIATALHRARSERELRQALHALENAVSLRSNKEPEHAQELSIRSFGFPLEIRCGEQVLHGDRLTRGQREILALLLAAPDFKLDQAELTAQLWPESPQERARSTLDTSLMRLRRLLQEELRIPQAREHLVARKGIIALEGCSIDLAHYRQLDQESRELRRSGHLQLARERLATACRLWRGEFLDSLSQHERVQEVRRQLTQTHLENCLLLARLCQEAGDVEEGIIHCQQGLTIDAGDEPLTGRLYALLLQQGLPVQAGQLLQTYEKHLLKDGMSRMEISLSLCRIKQPAS